MSLSKKSIVAITGAGSGIGRALSLRFVEDNVGGISISDVDKEGLDKTFELVKANGADVLASIVDVSNRRDVQRFADETVNRFGRVTHLVNNAGVGLVGRTEEVSFEDMEWLMNINFWGTVFGTKIFLRIMRKQNYGHIINISSVFGLMSPPGQSTYSASKFAVRGFTESLRHELDGTNIYVSCVHPGAIKTNIATAARQGESAPDEDKKQAPIIFKKISKTTAEYAADIIVKGIRSKNPRILVGKDAFQISLIQRMFPKRYFKIMDRISGGMLSKFR